MSAKTAKRFHAEFVELRRMVSSVKVAPSPESQRVLASAKAGLRVLRERSKEVKKAKAALAASNETAAKRRGAMRSVVGGTPLCEHKLPGCIQDMLAEYRRAEGQR